MPAPSPLLPRFPDGQTPSPHSEGWRGCGIALRHAQDEDIPWMRSLYASTREAELAGVPWPQEAKHAFLNSQFDLQHRHFLTNFPGAQWWVVLQHPHPHPNQPPAQPQPIGRYYLIETPGTLSVIDICLEPHSRRQGIGSALLQHTMAQAAAQGRSVSLHVAHHNPDALRWYQRSGFEAVNDLGSHLLMRWTPPSS